MKHFYYFLLLLILAFAGEITVNAQISIGETKETAKKITGKVYYTVDGIYVKEGLYYLCVTTDNSFDDVQFFQIGANKDEAISSLEAIITLYDSLKDNEKTTLNDPNGQYCTVIKHKGIGTFIDLLFPDCAGIGHLNKKVATTYIKIIQKYQE